MSQSALREALASRYIDPPNVSDGQHTERLAELAKRGSCRSFTDDPLPQDLLRVLLAVAFAAPTKSDLQQRDVIIVRDPALRDHLNTCCSTQTWLAKAPCLLVFCGNHRRQRRLHDLRRHAFVNDHFDATFNAAVDAGILMQSFVTAAEAAGLGCCPVSAMRNHARSVSDTLGLPAQVFPVAGLAVGWPADDVPQISMRMPLSSVIHEDRFDDSNEERAIEVYDQARHERQPVTKQRASDKFGEVDRYTWSEDKARQYALEERTTFGEYMRDQKLPFT